MRGKLVDLRLAAILVAFLVLQVFVIWSEEREAYATCQTYGTPGTMVFFGSGFITLPFSLLAALLPIDIADEHATATCVVVPQEALALTGAAVADYVVMVLVASAVLRFVRAMQRSRAAR